MDVAVSERIAANEALFRQINERIQQGHWPGEGEPPLTVRCECARLGCNAMIDLTPALYERVRTHPRRFIVVPGHELPEHETVVERGEHYVVVEKQGHAGDLAEATDPRS